MEEYKLIRDPMTETIQFIGPYNPKFIRILKKKIGSARWDPNQKCWGVDIKNEASFKKIILDLYGWSEDDPIELVNAEITFKEDIEVERNSIQMFNKTIARAYDRDSGADLGEDVNVLSGRFISGGSWSHWTTEAKAGTHIQLLNILKSVYERRLQKEKDKWNVEIKLFQPEVKPFLALSLQKQKLQDQMTELSRQMIELTEPDIHYDETHPRLGLLLYVNLTAEYINDLADILEKQQIDWEDAPVLAPIGDSILMRVLPEKSESCLNDNLRILNNYARNCEAFYICFKP